MDANNTDAHKEESEDKQVIGHFDGSGAKKTLRERKLTLCQNITLMKDCQSETFMSTLKLTVWFCTNSG